MARFYILSKRFCLKCKELSDARVALINRKSYGFAAHCANTHKVYKVNS